MTSFFYTLDVSGIVGPNIRMICDLGEHNCES